MKLIKNIKSLHAYILIVALLFLSPFIVTGQDKAEKPLPEGVYIKLNREFYESLKNKNKIYSNNPSEEYLRDISISSKFIVETNLQIIKQQEEIIRLLQSISDKKK